MAAGHFVPDRQLPFYRHIHFHHFNHPGRQFISQVKIFYFVLTDCGQALNLGGTL